MEISKRIWPGFGICPLLLTTTLIAGTLSVNSLWAAVEMSSEELYCVTFDEIGLVNPSVTFSDVPNIGDLTVSFGTHFVGQSLGTSSNSLADTSPLPPLQLSPDGIVKTMFDFASPTGIMLGGVQGKSVFTTPLAVLFSSGVRYLAFDLGHLDENTPTRIEAFDADGGSLGILDGLSEGYNTYSFGDTEGENNISGISIYVPNGEMDWEGFGINNVKISVDPNGVVPEPATFLVWSILTSCAVSVAWWKRHRGTKLG